MLRGIGADGDGSLTFSTAKYDLPFPRGDATEQDTAADVEEIPLADITGEETQNDVCESARRVTR